MGRENKNEAIASLHREQIMQAAKKLFVDKGFTHTSINDLSKASNYSRRTIYAYFESKEDILHHILEKGLMTLKQDIEKAIENNDDFICTYRTIFVSMNHYQIKYHYASDIIDRADSKDIENVSDTFKHILLLGNEINTLLSNLIQKGQEKGIVRKEIEPTLTVYIMWSSISSFLSLVQMKGPYITQQFSISDSDLLEYGFKQIMNSILVKSL